MTRQTKSTLFQWLKYILIAVMNTILSYAVYAICIKLGLHYVMASVMGYLISTYSAFILNTKYVFTPRGQKPEYTLQKMVRTYITYGFTGVVTYNAMLVLWIEILGISEFVAPILNIVINFPINYLMNKYWSFCTARETGKISKKGVQPKTRVRKERVQLKTQIQIRKERRLKKRNAA